ncbi:hypothetical protein GCM10009773_18050 [Williamsia serinedens]
MAARLPGNPCERFDLVDELGGTAGGFLGSFEFAMALRNKRIDRRGGTHIRVVWEPPDPRARHQ